MSVEEQEIAWLRAENEQLRKVLEEEVRAGVDLVGENTRLRATVADLEHRLASAHRYTTVVVRQRNQAQAAASDTGAMSDG